ncbi:DUF5977 domain-containing protein [Ferruginibacter profundus]
MKKLIYNALLLLLSVYATAQNANNFQKMVDFLPPAPNAAAIIKHSEISLNKNTGSPAINIPLFTVKGIKLSAGVSIGYSSTGIKVDEIASRVGMGWSLSAGGVITRTIRGWADENTTRVVPPFSTAGPNCGTYEFFDKVTSSSNSTGYDSEPDLYNFSMNGISGSFVFDASNQPVLIPAEKFKIEKDFSTSAIWNFKITTTDGIMYYFGGSSATEKTKRLNTCGKTFSTYLPNAWYLIKIEHPNGEAINLSYTGLTYNYETGVSETQNYGVFNPFYTCPAAPGSSTCINLLETQGVLLSSISAAGNSVQFSYTTRSDCGDKLVSSITQLTGSQTTGVFNFTYNQQQANATYLSQTSSGQSYTPYLTDLVESSGDYAFSKTHKFVYKDPGGRPPRLSYSQDHWGYFNGRINSTLIPKPEGFYMQERFPNATANREPDSAFGGKGLLTKIVYPTGGVDVIDYEGNDIVADPSFQTYHEYVCNVTGTSNTTEQTRTYTFTIDKAQEVELVITCTTQDATNYDPVHMQATVTLSNSSSTIFSEPFQASNPGTVYIRRPNQLYPGTYTLTYKAKGAAQTTDIKLKFYPETHTGTTTNKIVGGMRVKRVSTSNPGETPVIKRYYYAKMDELNLSSLMPVPTPIYWKDYVNTSSINCHYWAMYSGSLNNLYNYGSAPISYAYVIESNGENFEGGAIQDKFYAGGDVNASVWWLNEIMGAPLSNWSAPLNGKLSEEIIYKKPASGALFPIKKTQYTYAPLEDRLHTKLYGYTINAKYGNVGTWQPPSWPCSNPSAPTVNPSNPDDDPTNRFDAMRYDIDSYWLHLRSQTETLYDENGANPVTTVTNMYFDNEDHQQLSRNETTNSKGETLKTTNTYISDLTGTVPNAMKAKNMITQLVTSKTENGSNEVSFDKINYGDAGNNNYVPVSVEKSVKGNTLETEGTIDLYDANGNILQFTNKAGIVSAVIWGYNSQYPVAQIVGATYANAVAQLTGGSVTALQTMDGTTLQTELNLVRTALPNARVTSYTYKPMVGVTSITDPNNKTNTYNYDSFNRLLTIKDQDGNFVKKNEYVYATPDNSSAPTIYFNTAVTQYINCQTCVSGYSAAAVAYTVPFGKYFSLISQADADSKAAADTGGQEYANKNGKCISSASYACTGSQYRLVNCSCEAGTKVCESTSGSGPYTVSYHYHWSDGYNGPTITETITCSGIDKKLINCTCETGVKVCDGVTNNGGGSYTVNYHYHWSDNSNSSTITETFTCSGNDKKIINCTCETGIKIYTSSVFDRKGNMGCAAGQWLCTYHYHWSDGSNSADYTECSASDCGPY